MTPEQYQRVQELFLRAVQMDPNQRERWLASQCAGDDELKSDVQRLLANDVTQTLVKPVVPNAPKKQSVKRSFRFSHLLRGITPRGLMALGALAVLLPLLLCGVLADRALDKFKGRIRAATLVELVNARASAIRFWLSREQTVVQSWADSTEVRQLITELVELSRESDRQAGGETALLRDAPQHQLLHNEMETLAGRAVRYAVWDSHLVTIADWSSDKKSIGVGVTPSGAERLTRVLHGRAHAVMLGPKDAITRDYLEMPTKPMLGMLVPVRSSNGNVVAAMLVYDTGAEEELGEFIRLTTGSLADEPVREDADAGTFVFDRAGMLLYNSPYDSQLRSLGLIANQYDSFSAKHLELRDPGVDLTRGQTPAEPFAARPKTKLVRSAVGEGAGVDVDGYRDVRGVTVAGAWRWLDDYEFGIGIEIDKNALEPAMWLARFQSWAILGLLGTSLGVIGYSLITVRRLRRRLGSEHRIGPYQLEEMVGEGGMGRVFKASHELLKRPTAIKLMRPEVINEISTARFQREAQLAARLEHPNTISVFDFGVSDEGLCFLVMEWIDGVTLEALVANDGRISVERAIGILRQIAMSLREAHLLGLIHRDLKPQNVMVTQRAGETDVVKVLDFGLARDLTAQAEFTLTAQGLIAGTPKYMAPERWDATQPIGPAVDIFAFGCIAYFILTGQHAIKGETIAEMVASSLSPSRPSELLAAEAIPPWLDDLTVDCLAREWRNRPSSFDEVLDRVG